MIPVSGDHVHGTTVARAVQFPGSETVAKSKRCGGGKLYSGHTGATDQLFLDGKNSLMKTNGVGESRQR